MKRALPVLVVLLVSFQLNAQWVQTNGPYGGRIVCLASSGSIIFASTPGDVFLSTNNGANWSTINKGLPKPVLSGDFNPNISALMISGTNLFAGTSDSGIYLSTNSGTNWKQLNNGLPDSTGIVALTVIGNSIFAAAVKVPFGGSNGVILSTDNGTSWIQINNGLTNLDVRSFAVSGSNIYAGTYGSGVFLSTNNGSNWTQVNNGLPNTNNEILSLAVCGDNIFAGTYFGVYLSTNNGTNWTQVNSGLTNNTVFAFTVSGADIYAGTGDGVFLSTNNGTNWSKLNLIASSVLAITYSGTNIYAATDGGIFLSTNNGADWTQVYDNQGLETLTASGTNIFAGTENGVILSTDNGTTWTINNDGLPNTLDISLVASGTNIFAGTDLGVYLSTNNGTNWIHQLNYGLGQILKFYSLVITGDNIFAGINGVVYLSTNNGTSWILVDNGLTNKYVQTLVCSGTNIFAGTMLNGVYLSTDNGTNWVPVNNGITLNDVIIDNGIPQNLGVFSFAVSGNNVFAAKDSEVYLSTNNGANWTNISTGLHGGVDPLAILGTNIFAGTGGAGVWRRPLSEITGVTNEVKAVPKEYTLFQNYPNPFNPTTTIKYSVPIESNVNIRVYNSLGQTVREINEGNRQPGSYEINFDASGLSSGIYFYSIKAGSADGNKDFSTVKKMILLK